MIQWLNITIKRIVNALWFLTKIFMIVAMGVVIMMFVYPYNILQVHNSPYPVEQQIAYRGGTQTYLADYCKYGSYSAVSTRSFIQVNGVNFRQIDSNTINSTEGCRAVKFTVNIPMDLPTGTYTIITYLTYRPNPFREVSYRIQSAPFEVQ